MSYPTLTVPSGCAVHRGTGVDTKFRVNVAPFGDGYSQISADGINSVRDMPSVVVVGPPDAIETFRTSVKALKGLPFMFTMPYEETTRQFRCTGMSASYDFGGTTVTLELEESFAP